MTCMYCSSQGLISLNVYLFAKFIPWFSAVKVIKILNGYVIKAHLKIIKKQAKHIIWTIKSKLKYTCIKITTKQGRKEWLLREQTKQESLNLLSKDGNRRGQMDLLYREFQSLSVLTEKALSWAEPPE